MESDLAHDINNLIVDCQRDPKVEMWEREVVRDFGSRLEVAIEEMERDYEEHKDENPAVREYFFRNFSHIMGIPGNVPRGIHLGERAANRIQKIWTAILGWLDKFIKEHKEALQVDTWSIGATAGFPSGVSGTVTVSFKE